MGLEDGVGNSEEERESEKGEGGIYAGSVYVLVKRRKTEGMY